jgi:hypothetical protein
MMIDKKIFYAVFMAMLLFSCSSNNNKYDQRAIDSFDKMSEAIGNLESCSYSLSTYVSKKDGDQYSNENDVYMRGPDKMYIHTIGTKGERSYWYDGKSMGYFNYSKNTYDTVPAPDNIIKTIDELNNKYGIDFPAGDFFYPTFTDDMIGYFDEIMFYGDETIDGVDCVVSEAVNDKYLVHIWIDKKTNLPHKLVISNVNNPLGYYEAVFSNWRENPHLPDIMFEFEPPQDSKRVAIKTKN